MGSNLACGLVFLCFFTYIMFKLHFNETMTYTYDTKVIVKLSPLVQRFTHFVLCGIMLDTNKEKFTITMVL